ncbi:MAG: hypothetical protein H7246_13005 [Phycisphaerae bacterium]|nr:hypothetical protein [Saprospiraceae bacterium]
MLTTLPDRALLLAATGLCVIAAWCTIGYHHPDEHFQIWEFANYKLGHIPATDLPWEFPAQMRPGLQPFLAYSTVLAAQKMGVEDPFLQIFFTRLLCGFAAIWVYWSWCLWLERDFKNPSSARWLRIGLLFFWFMPYLNVRFSSENTSAICFFGGLLLLLQQLENQRGRINWQMITAGFLLGISFFFRYQIAFAGIGLIAWLVFQKRLAWFSWVALVVGVLLACGLGFSADFWLYGTWVCPPYQYFVTNVLHSDARFGTEPWWWYLNEALIDLLPPFSIALLIFFALGIWQKPRHVLTWCFVPFVLAHFAVEHKEMRFLFPMMLPFFFFSVAGWEFFQEKYEKKKWMLKTLAFGLWINVILLVFWMLMPAKGMAAYSKFLWNWHEKQPASKVYFVKKEPRNHYPLNMPFYENPAQGQASWYTEPMYRNDTMALRSGDLMFFTEVLSPPPIAPPGFGLKRVYAYYPHWVLSLNINDWQSRTRIWAIYEVMK